MWICLLPFHSRSVSRLTKLTNQSWSWAADCNPTNKVVDGQLDPQQSSPMFNPVWICKMYFLAWIRAGLVEMISVSTCKPIEYLTLLFKRRFCQLQCVCAWANFALLSLSFLALPRNTVEILCCSAKALHLPVITSHPSLLWLPWVKPSCALCAPFPHPFPSPPFQICGHCSNYVECTLSVTLGVGG